jgi:histidine phosphotransfer protein HptB
VPDPARSLLHFDRIRDLADQLDSRDLTLEFLGTYLHMLPGRLKRILDGIHDCDDKASHDAVLSLKTASSMSGAVSAEAACLELEPLVRGRQFGLALVSARRLSVEVTALHETAPEILAEAHRDLGGMAA